MEAASLANATLEVAFSWESKRALPEASSGTVCCSLFLCFNQSSLMKLAGQFATIFTSRFSI